MTRIIIGHGIEIDIDSPVEEGHSEKELLHRVIGILKHQERTIEYLKSNMITAAQLKASSDALILAVTAEIATSQGGGGTPDSDVLAYQTAVDAQTSRLNAASGGGSNPPPPDAWQPNTSYSAGQSVTAPDGTVVTSIAAQTSGTTYDPSLWTVVTPAPAARRARR